MNLQEIKQAIENGQKVYWSNEAYEVIKDSKGQYLISYQNGKNCIGLTWTDGTTLNAKEEEFYTKEGIYYTVTTQTKGILTFPTAKKALARIKKFGYPIIFILCMLSVSCSAQNAKVGKDGNYYATTSEKKSTQPAKTTGKTFTDSKGKTYPVMMSANGKLFIIRTSAKTGKEYKQYLKL